MVIGIETDRSATYDFLLVIHSSHEPLSYHFPYKRRFSIPVKLSPPAEGSPNGAMPESRKVWRPFDLFVSGYI